MLQKGDGRDEFIELENMNERVVKNVQHSCDGIPEIESEMLDIPEMLESSISSEWQRSIRLTKESTQNVLPQVILNPIFDESNETHVPAENIVYKYPQRSNKGVPKK